MGLQSEGRVTQGEQLAEALKLRPHTYLEMNALAISVSPHKRLLEWAERNPEWRIVKARRYLGDGKYATTWAVKRIERSVIWPAFTPPKAA